MTLKPELPIYSVLPAITECLLTHTRLVLEAPPGAGKTTQVPLALLLEPWCQSRGKPGKILMLEPRRVAARAAAGYMASQLNETVGNTVGYRIRFDNKVSASTRIEVLTEGILTRMLQDDPTLDGVAAILFDEFHERHLAGDLGLALALDIQSSLRPDLRLVIMSATLDGVRLASWLDAQRISSPGRSFAVSVEHIAGSRDETLTSQLSRCIDKVISNSEGDVLVFLPGQREINQIKTVLTARALPDIEVISLYGDMPLEQQTAALSPASNHQRRIILATNLAESSLTLPGVRVVIDSGLAREPRFDPNSGFTRLETVPISQASADQRAGRAGRVAPGWCYRLWPANRQLSAERNPEINTVDLSGLALEMAVWGSTELRFLDSPPAGTLAAGRDLLEKLGALQGSAITALGKRMLQLGTHPRLAAMLLAALFNSPLSSNSPDSTDSLDSPDSAAALACDLAALLESRDPLTGDRGDDWQSRWQALAQFRDGSSSRSHKEYRSHHDHGVSRAALNAIDQAARQWRRRLGLRGDPPDKIDWTDIGDRLMHAYPDRIAYRHEENPWRYQLSNGRGARLREDSRLRGEPWLVVSELRHDQKDSLILMASPLSEVHLRADFADRFVTEDTVHWDDGNRALLSRRETRFEQIVLDSRPAGRPDPAAAAQALCDAVAGYGLDCLPWTEPLRQWQIRVQCLREWMPALGLPDLSDQCLIASLDHWLLPTLQGKFRLDALRAEELADALHALLDWSQCQMIEREAPVRIRVPSGLERPIHYAIGAAPVLSVKLQELFGLGETPRIAGDRIALTLHLLSPGGKPLQVTQDLRSFWNNTYPQVKKEMKGRYPRHPWPDDPWAATATHRAKPRGT